MFIICYQLAPKSDTLLYIRSASPTPFTLVTTIADSIANHATIVRGTGKVGLPAGKVGLEPPPGLAVAGGGGEREREAEGG